MIFGDFLEFFFLLKNFIFFCFCGLLVVVELIVVCDLSCCVRGVIFLHF